MSGRLFGHSVTSVAESWARLLTRSRSRLAAAFSVDSRKGTQLALTTGLELVGYSGIWRPNVAGDALVFLGCAFAELDGDELVAFVGRAKFEG